MAFNSSTQKVATKGLIKVVETLVTGRLEVLDERGVDKPLGCTGNVSILSEDKIGESSQISGTANFSAIYLLGDKSVASGKLVVDFFERVELAGVENVAFVPAIKSVKTTKESDHIIIINAVVETKVYGVKFDEVSILVGEDEGYYTVGKTQTISTLTAATNTGFMISDRIEIDAANILAASCYSTASKVTPFDNYAVIEGSCLVDLFVGQGEQIKQIQKVIDFSQEVPVLNLTPNAIVDFCLTDKSLTCSVDTSTDVEGAHVLDVGLGLSLWGFEKLETNLISDAFSDRKLIDLTYSSFENSAAKEAKICTDRKTLIVDVESKKRMDEIIFAGPAISRTDEVRVKDGVVAMIGHTNIPVTYKNYDSDEIAYTILTAEFELMTNLEASDGEVYVDVDLKSRINSYKNKAGKDISFVVDFDYVLSSVECSTEAYVSKLSEVGEVKNSAGTIIVYKPKKNEGVFEIAKNLQVSPDVIRIQNPQIEDGKEIQQVVVYKKSR